VLRGIPNESSELGRRDIADRHQMTGPSGCRSG
jgi:hypothetical protein